MTALGFIAALVILLPSRNSSPGRRIPPGVPEFSSTTDGAPLFTPTVSAAEERARKGAEKTVLPLAAQLVNAMITGTHVGDAYALMAPQLQNRSVGDRGHKRHLPLSLNKGDSLASTTIAYSSAGEVGLVISIKRQDRDDGLVAIRFDKVGRRWLIDYIHQGAASTRIDASNYAPRGFLPASHRETTRTWLILGLGVIGLAGGVALLDWRMSRTRPSGEARRA